MTGRGGKPIAAREENYVSRERVHARYGCIEMQFRRSEPDRKRLLAAATTGQTGFTRKRAESARQIWPVKPNLIGVIAESRRRDRASANRERLRANTSRQAASGDNAMSAGETFRKFVNVIITENSRNDPSLLPFLSPPPSPLLLSTLLGRPVR